MIYFVLLEDGNIKIGCTDNLARRMNSFPSSADKRVALLVLGVHEGNRNIEQEVHRRFDHLRIDRRPVRCSSEDFYPGPDLAAYIIAYCEQTPDVDAANRLLVNRCLARIVRAKSTYPFESNYPSEIHVNGGQ